MKEKEKVGFAVTGEVIDEGFADIVGALAAVLIAFFVFRGGKPVETLREAALVTNIGNALLSTTLSPTFAAKPPRDTESISALGPSRIPTLTSNSPKKIRTLQNVNHLLDETANVVNTVTDAYFACANN